MFNPITSRRNTHVDEIAGDSNLSADVRKLRKGGMEQSVLFPKRFLGAFDVRLLNLKFHVCVCDLGNVRQEKHHCQHEYKACYSKIDPLNVFEGLDIVIHVLEKDVRSQCGPNNGSDAIESLSKVDADLRIAWRTADGEVWIGCSLESSQAGANDECSTSKPVSEKECMVG